MCLSIECSSRFGPVVISNDSCTHIIEVSFPKMHSIDAFVELYQSTWQELEEHLTELELEIYIGSCIDDCTPRNSAANEKPKRPHAIDLNDLDMVNWRPKETDQEGARLSSFLKRRELKSPLFVRSFPACFTATHVNLDVDAEDVIKRLPGLYIREAEVPSRFSQCGTFRQVRGKCVRLLAWLENFHRPYPMLGIPDRLPRSVEEYREICSKCDGRDFSFVSIRDAHRVEFRSACSQPTIDDLLELIQFRLESYRSSKDMHPMDLDFIRNEFKSACLMGWDTRNSE